MLLFAPFSCLTACVFYVMQCCRPPYNDKWKRSCKFCFSKLSWICGPWEITCEILFLFDLFFAIFSVFNFCMLLQDSCTSALEKYGVGSCGPRGFYGTIGQFFHVETLFKWLNEMTCSHFRAQELFYNCICHMQMCTLIVKLELQNFWELQILSFIHTDFQPCSVPSHVSVKRVMWLLCK